MKELREGMQVRIKSVHEYYDDIRDKTLTLIECFSEGNGKCWYVDFEGRKDDWVVGEDDVCPVKVTVIEGETGEVGGEWWVGDTNFTLLPWTSAFPDVGKRVRITIEEVSP